MFIPINYEVYTGIAKIAYSIEKNQMATVLQIIYIRAQCIYAHSVYQVLPISGQSYSYRDAIAH